MDIETLLFDAEERMEKALVALERDFGKLRTGRATTASWTTSRWTTTAP